MMYIYSNDASGRLRSLEWHVGEPFPTSHPAMSGKTVSLQADGQEVGWLKEAIMALETQEDIERRLRGKV